MLLTLQIYNGKNRKKVASEPYYFKFLHY